MQSAQFIDMYIKSYYLILFNVPLLSSFGGCLCGCAAYIQRIDTGICYLLSTLHHCLRQGLSLNLKLEALD